MSVKQQIKMPDFEADQQDVLDKSNNLKLLSNEVQKMESISTEI